MSDVVKSIPFPLDEGFFRRACHFCVREFKIPLSEDDLLNISQNILNHYLEIVEENQNNVVTLFYCPYCGQSENNHGWCWMTKEQTTYVKTHVENIAFEIVHRELKSTFSIGFDGFEYKPAKIELKNAWISPETNDMKIFDLPCCDTSIKILNDWEEKTHCFLCGFPHN